MKRVIAIVQLCLALGIGANAATYTSAQNGAWSSSTTWSPAGVPTWNDVVVVQHNVTLAAGTYNGSGSVTVQSGGTLTVSGNLTVTGSNTKLMISTGGTLSVSGTFQLGNQSTTTLSGGTIGATTMNVNGGTYNATSGVANVGTLTTSTSGNTSLTNGINATLNVSGNVTSDNHFLNNGTMTVAGSVTHNNSGGTFTNAGQMTVSTNFIANGTVKLNPGSTASSKLAVLGNMTVTGNSLTVGTNVTPPNYADLVVYGNLGFTGGQAYVEKNGRVAIFGDLNLTGGGIQFNINSGGQVYVDGDGSGADINISGGGGNNVNNNNPNVTPPFGLYVNGSVSVSGGGSSVDTDRADEVVMQNNNAPFYNWVASQPNSPLPIELLYFKVEHVDELGVSLTWATTREKNFDYFLLERASADFTFTPITQISGNGGLSEVTGYQFTDQNPLPGKNYYRLKSVDVDGAFEYSRLVVADSKGSVPAVSTYPNPVEDQSLHVFIRDALSLPATARVLNARGEILYEATLVESSTVITLPQGMQPGIYLLRLSASDGTALTKIVVK